MQELNEDKTPLVGVDVSTAFLQGVHLGHANQLRADMSSADRHGSDLTAANLMFADQHDANFRGTRLENVSLADADLKDAEMVGSDLTDAELAQSDLSGADLRSSNVSAVKWKGIKSINAANIAGVKGAPEGFVQWALANGAVEDSRVEE